MIRQAYGVHSDRKDRDTNLSRLPVRPESPLRCELSSRSSNTLQPSASFELVEVGNKYPTSAPTTLAFSPQAHPCMKR